MRTIARISLLFILCAVSGLSRPDEAKIRHQFLLLSAGDIRLRNEAKQAEKRLIKWGDDAVLTVTAYADRKSPRKRHAIETIVRGVGEDAVEPVVRLMASQDDDIAPFAAYLLDKIGSKKAATPLMLAAGSANSKLRSTAIGALGNCGNTSAVPILLKALSDTTTSIRRKAACSLGKLGDIRAIEPLIPLLSDSCAFVRYSASNAIASIGGPDATGLLLQKLDIDSLDETEKYHIIETLGMLGGDESLPVLTSLLEDPQYLNRGFACQALGHFRGDYEVANALKRSIHDASGFVRMMAEGALREIRSD